MKTPTPPQSVNSTLPEPLPYNAQTDSPLTIYFARRGMTIKDFARAADLNYHQVIHTLTGRYPNLRVNTLEAMAKVAGMRTDHMREYIKLEIEWRKKRKQTQVDQADQADQTNTAAPSNPPNPD